MAYSGSQLPPSFSPSGNEGNGRNNGNGRQRHATDPSHAYRQPDPSASQAGGVGQVPPSFAPGGQQAANGATYRPTQQRSAQHHVAQPRTAQPFGTQPSSFAPRAASARSSMPRGTGSRVSYAQPNQPLPSYIAPTPVATGGDAAVPPTGTVTSGMAGTPGEPQRPRRRRRHSGKHITLTIIAALLVVIIIFVASQIAWINRSLNHQRMLSGSANTAGSTWLILGSDARDGTVGGTQEEVPGFRNDTILVLTKPSSGPASLISIPRDSYVTVDGNDMKINAVAETYGYPQLVKTVEGITGVTIDHVALIGFSGVMGIVDALGGVELCLDYDVDDAYSGLQWTAGCHTADGTTALAFARMRYSDPKGDIGRAERQRQVISAIMTKVTSDKSVRTYSTLHKVGDATLGALTVDENTNAFTLLQMAIAFRDATGSGGVTGSVYYSSVDYQPASGIGSCVLLDDDKNLDLFKALSRGTQQAGTVGGYTGA